MCLPVRYMSVLSVICLIITLISGHTVLLLLVQKWSTCTCALYITTSLSLSILLYLHDVLHVYMTACSVCVRACVCLFVLLCVILV